MFEVGDKVVCIRPPVNSFNDAGKWLNGEYDLNPEKEFTVSEVTSDRLRLKECTVRIPTVPYFYQSRFKLGSDGEE